MAEVFNWTLNISESTSLLNIDDIRNVVDSFKMLAIAIKCKMMMTILLGIRKLN